MHIYMHTNINMEMGYSELLSDVSLIMPFLQALQSNTIRLTLCRSQTYQLRVNGEMSEYPENDHLYTSTNILIATPYTVLELLYFKK